MPSLQDICKEYKQAIGSRGNTIKQIQGKIHFNSNQRSINENQKITLFPLN